MNKIIILVINLTFFINYVNAQNVGIGTTSPAASAALDINSVTGAVLLPRMNTTQRNALTPVEGMMIYNTDVLKFQGYGLVFEGADQQQSSYDIACTGAGCGSKWQSFTQFSSNIVTSVKLYVVGWSGCIPATVTVKIRTGTGLAGTVVQSSSVTVQTVGTQLLSAPFHTALTPGSVYTIEFISPATGCNGTHDSVEWMLSNNNFYPSGYSFCCTALPNQDFNFAVNVGTFGWVNLY